MAGALIAGGVMSGVGVLTGNKKLQKYGGLLSLAGGIGGLATGAWSSVAGEVAGSAGNAAQEGFRAAEFAAQAGSGTEALGAIAQAAPGADALGGITQAGSGADAVGAAMQTAAPVAATAPSIPTTVNLGSLGGTQSTAAGMQGAYDTAKQGLVDMFGTSSRVGGQGGLIGDSMAWMKDNSRLTQAGERLAALVLRRHRLIELFLVKVMGMSWTEVHDEAEHLEHAVSDRLIERIDEMLGRPEVDPHGDPIPDPEGTVRRLDYDTLLTCPLNALVTVSRVSDQDSEFLKFVERHDLKPGENVWVEARDAAGDSVRLRGRDNRQVTIGARAASKVLVQTARILVAWLLLSSGALAQTTEPSVARLFTTVKPGETIVISAPPVTGWSKMVNLSPA